MNNYHWGRDEGGGCNPTPFAYDQKFYGFIFKVEIFFITEVWTNGKMDITSSKLSCLKKGCKNTQIDL